MNTKRHHCINYIELPSNDLALTENFYKSVFGWKFTSWGPEYSSFEGAGIDGGFRGDGEVKTEKPGILVVLYSEDLLKTESAIVAAGGKIIVPTFEFPGGRRFHFTDPNGNELAVWSE